MYLVSQRVVSAKTGRQGINSFLYQHDEGVLTGVAFLNLLDAPPGRLIDKCILIEPPGNSVKSYLDIVLPEDSTPRDVTTAVEQFIGGVSRTSSMPWIVGAGPFAVRFLCDNSIAPVWEREVRTLLGAATALLVNR